MFPTIYYLDRFKAGVTRRNKDPIRRTINTSTRRKIDTRKGVDIRKEYKIEQEKDPLNHLPNNSLDLTLGEFLLIFHCAGFFIRNLETTAEKNISDLSKYNKLAKKIESILSKGGASKKLYINKQYDIFCFLQDRTIVINTRLLNDKNSRFFLWLIDQHLLLKKHLPNKFFQTLAYSKRYMMFVAESKYFYKKTDTGVMCRCPHESMPIDLVFCNGKPKFKAQSFVQNKYNHKLSDQTQKPLELLLIEWGFAKHEIRLYLSEDVSPRKCLLSKGVTCFGVYKFWYEM